MPRPCESVDGQTWRERDCLSGSLLTGRLSQAPECDSYSRRDPPWSSELIESLRRAPNKMAPVSFSTNSNVFTEFSFDKKINNT
ncbi:hypothetical protein RRG08_063779 [Elysia crispata]|uniref:Uncharacterized protein n=1 Tax=Elysia crispata TaxID=231223 RepID=A0AAE1AK24_9GAST|nr:hypothetical protein RRG08_063779 [Elysia crispata]